MGIVAVVVYRPKAGMDRELFELVRDHHPILASEQLVTERKPLVLKAADGSLVEIFEWKSSRAIQDAHHNDTVLAMWERFAKTCDYECLANLDESKRLFSEFQPLDLSIPA